MSDKKQKFQIPSDDQERVDEIESETSDNCVSFGMYSSIRKGLTEAYRIGYMRAQPVAENPTFRERVIADLVKTKVIVEKPDARVQRLLDALKVIKKALNDDPKARTEGFRPARKLADKWGIFNDDLEGLRVLYRLADAALAEWRKP